MPEPLVFHLVPHTHWDREWYLARAAFHARLVPVMDDLLARLRTDPAYRSFLLDGQSVLVRDYLTARPDREPEVRALVQAGRLQVGPWYVLADEQIPSGESLIRNLLLGQRDASRYGGRLDVLYSPDAFGHPAVWPTLAREFGIRYGVLWRGLGCDANGARDCYRWNAPDGASVFLYHLPPEGYEVGAALSADRAELARRWKELRKHLLARASSRHVAVFVGADHHAAPADLPRVRELLSALEPASECRLSRLDEFLRAAEQDAGEVRTLDGELRWSYGYTWTLQGVHATRAHQKRRNAELELMLERTAEPLAALTELQGGHDRRPLLDLAWRRLVECHFHDAIGGCASDDVARAVDVRFDEVEGYATEIARGALFELIGHDPDRAREAPADSALVLWNPAARRRRGIVVAEITCFRRDVFVGPPGDRVPREGRGCGELGLVDETGEPIAVQVLDRRPGLERLDAARHYPDLDEVERVRVAFHAPELRGLGFARLGGGPLSASGLGDAVWLRARTLGNRFVTVTAERDGTLTLEDRRTGERYSGLLTLESGGDVGDTYTYCPPPGDRVRRLTGSVSIQPVAWGPLLAALEVRYADVRLLVTLHADSAAVRCTLEVDNRTTDHRLRAWFPLGISGMPAVAGAQLGVVTRAPVVVRAADYPDETPVATAPAHRFVAAAHGERGLALFAPGFFEYEWTPEGDLRFTVLRSVGELSRADLPTRPGHAGWATPTPLAQCLGLHRLQLAIQPVGEGDIPARLPATWEELFLPIRGVWLRQPSGPLVASEEGAPPLTVELEGEGLAFSAVKPADEGEGLVLRCYNIIDRPVDGAWRLGAPVSHAARVRADERNGDAVEVEGERTIRFTAGPRELVTFVVRGER